MTPGPASGSRPRVAMLSFDYIEYCIPIANALSRHADVCLMLPRQDVAPHLGDVDPAVRLWTFDKPRLRQPLRQARMCRRIARELRRLDPDVVHLQQGHLWLNLALPLLRLHPLVVTIHDPEPHPGDRSSRKTPQPVMDLGFRQADRVIVHAEGLRRAAADRARVAPDAVDVVPLVALGDRVAPPEAVTEEPATVLFFGRIWPYKGLDHLIRAEPLISAAMPDVRIVIAGEGEDLDRYRRMMVHPERFEVIDEFVSTARRAELFARASVVALPYVEATQSAVIPIAYAFGKPVVATRVGGLPEFVDHGRTGFLVPPGDEAALAEAIVRLLRDPRLRRELGAAGRRRLETLHSPEAVARQTLAVYERARAPRAPARQRAEVAAT